MGRSHFCRPVEAAAPASSVLTMKKTTWGSPDQAEASSLKAGSNCKQETHQFAQKFNTTTFPFSIERAIGVPSGRCATNAKTLFAFALSSAAVAGIGATRS